MKMKSEKITVSHGYEIVNGKKRQVRKSERINIPSSVKTKLQFLRWKEKEKKRLLEVLKKEIATGKQQKKNNLEDKMTLVKFMDKEIKMRIKEGTLTEKAKKKNKAHYDFIKNSDIGHKILKKITVADCREFKAEVANKKNQVTNQPISDKTKYNLYGVFLVFMKAAYKQEFIETNPSDRVDNFKYHSEEQPYLTMPEVIELLKRLDELDIREKTMILFLLYTGVRRAEALSVQWEDFQIETLLDNTEYRFFRLKGKLETENANRLVEVPPLLWSVLLEFKKWQDFQAETREWGVREGFVFLTNEGKRMHPDVFSSTLSIALSRIGCNVKGSHAFRRTFASLMCANGADVKEISNMLGHGSTAVTEKHYIKSFVRKSHAAAFTLLEKEAERIV